MEDHHIFCKLQGSEKRFEGDTMQIETKFPKSDLPMKPSKHCKMKIAVASIIIVLLIIAAVVSAVLIVLLKDNSNKSPSNTVYYRGSFRVLNVTYTDDYRQSNGPAFQSLSANIESFIDTAFNNSELKSQYKESKVIKISPGNVSEFILIFNFTDSESRNASIQKILSEKVKNTSRAILNIDLSSLQISEQLTLLLNNILFGSGSNTGTTENPSNSFAECGVGGPSASTKIVGGTNAALGAWPWQASLRFFGIHLCGASLISNTWLVTAAHCFDTLKQVMLWTVSLGSIDPSNGVGFSIKNIIIHEKYNIATNENDIALIELSAPVTFTQYIRPVCLPAASTIVPDNSSCYVTGWGALTEGAKTSAPILQQAELKTINTNLCRRLPAYVNTFRSSMLCAGYLAGNVDACQGDSGGPLVTLTANNKWFLYGIVSYGDGCGEQNKPGIYSNYHNVTWVHVGSDTFSKKFQIKRALKVS
ncbi:transmembrane protease serine 11A-like [Gastrophryne carolinensis]